MHVAGAVIAIGDVAQLVFPRSAVKPLQALALVESGAAARYGLGGGGAGARLRLAQRRAASRGGGAADAGGRRPSADDLECGPQAPAYLPAAEALIRTWIEPTAHP